MVESYDELKSTLQVELTCGESDNTFGWFVRFDGRGMRYRMVNTHKNMFKRDSLLVFYLFCAPLCVCCGSADLGASNSTPATQSRAASARGAAKKVLTETVLRAASTPIQDAVAWIVDENSNIFTHWLRGNQLGIELNFMRPGLVLPGGDAILELLDEETEIELCDCADGQRADDREQCVISGKPGRGLQLSIVDKFTAEQTPLISLPRTSETPAEYQIDWTPLATLGPYLFISIDEQLRTCSERNTRYTKEILVYDLERRKRVDIVNAWDFTAELSKAREKAVTLFNDEEFSHITSVDEVRLIGIEPSYDHLFILRLNFRFVVENINEGGSGSSPATLLSEMKVPASTIPETLVPYALPPAVVSIFGRSTMQFEHGGWNLITGDEQTRLRLFQAFSSTSSEDEEN